MAMSKDQIIDMPFTTDAMKAAIERRIIQSPQLSDADKHELSVILARLDAQGLATLVETVLGHAIESGSEILPYLKRLGEKG
ncbi:hypothetical protein B0W47_03195 [Komagataeibacter nataicola]|uniref:Uncharacterized protein n=2 Tax=Komagataeibacter nataicola TaxID=265960 RepID=A0A9N7CFM5_9PROT|nr:hypothetical protein B0W47_03195 [Komagataeibacter nataicola]PYD66782.1 hypothetical protein CDI09_06410 [Komagataeibacter nataicola]GBR22473.1 hypothetical protein AA0616_2281 [Komagataeibacter nataicola NRIC 0616]